MTPAFRLIVLSALVALCACGFGSTAREQVHKTVPTSAAPAVRVDNVAGSIQIDSWDKPTVDVTATKSANDTAALRNIAIEVRTEGDGVSIATKYADGPHDGGVSYRIVVPAGASLDVRDTAGSVHIAGVRGNVTVATEAGSVTADLGKIAAGRSVDLTATTGQVRLIAAAGSDAHVQANTTVGSFASDFPSVVEKRENLVGSSATGNIGSGSARVRLLTTTGSIHLERGTNP